MALNFLDIIQWDSWHFRAFKQLQVRERRLSPFDLGRQHCLFANIEVEEKLQVREQASQTVEATQRQIGLLHEIKQSRTELYGWLGRQRVGNKAPERLGR